MKYYLVALLFIIMGAGARTMFEIAHQGLTQEHGLTPDGETQKLIFLALWYVVMMVADIVLLRHAEIKMRNVFIALMSIGILIPTVYMFLTH